MDPSKPRRTGLIVGLSDLSIHEAQISPHDSSIFKAADEDLPVPASRDQDPRGQAEGHALDGGGVDLV